MHSRYLSVLIFMALSAPLLSGAADLRVGITRYDGGAAIYGLSQNQQLICDNCPSGPELAPAPPRPAIQYEPHDAQQIVMELPQEFPEAKEETTVVPKGLSVFFGFNRDDLTAEEKRRIREALAGGLDSAVKVKVDGYTCRIGSEVYNRKLSARRAKAVAQYLLSLGVKVDAAEGLGKKHHRGAAIPRDRRAEILIKEGTR